MELGRINISDIEKCNNSCIKINKIIEKLGININGKKITIIKNNNMYIVKEII